MLKCNFKKLMFSAMTNVFRRNVTFFQFAKKCSNIRRQSAFTKPINLSWRFSPFPSFSLVVPRRNFRLSRPWRAIPPILWMFIRPLTQLGAIIFGRFFRRWWLKLPAEERKARLRKIFRNRKRLMVGGGSMAGLLSLYYYYHVEKCPFTNRRRFITVTRKQFKELCDLQTKLLLTQLAPFLLPENDFRVHHVKKLTRRLLKGNSDISVIKDFDWAVHVIDYDIPNVMVIPNGHIFVFTSMLDNFANVDQLGIVLGHEMAHAVLGHGLEQSSRDQLLDSLMILCIAIIWAAVPGFAAAVTHYFALLAVKIASQLPHSRQLEIEADEYGLQLAAKACFDPREVYAFWVAIMMKGKIEGKIDIPDFLCTHPNHGDRAARLEPIIEHALKIRAECDYCPALKPYDPRILAKAKKEMIERQLATRGYII